MKNTQILLNNKFYLNLKNFLSLKNKTLIMIKPGWREYKSNLTEKTIKQLIGRGSPNPSVDFTLTQESLETLSSHLLSLGWSKIKLIVIHKNSTFNNNNLNKEKKVKKTEVLLQFYFLGDFLKASVLTEILKNIDTETIIIFPGSWALFCFYLRILGYHLGPGLNHYRMYPDGLDFKRYEFLKAIGFTESLAEASYKKGLQESKKKKEEYPDRINHWNKLLKSGQTMTSNEKQLVLNQIYLYPQRLHNLSLELATNLITLLEENPQEDSLFLLHHLQKYVDFFKTHNEILINQRSPYFYFLSELQKENLRDWN